MKNGGRMSKPLTYEEMLELAVQRERENRKDFPKQETENPDEIIVQDIEMFHAEVMEEGKSIWIGITRKNGQVDHINISTKGKKLSVLWTPATGHTNPNHSLNK
jgi:hypothetical protein